MQEIGEVIELQENNIAVVQFRRTSICKSCNVCYLAEQNKELMVTEARNEAHARIGDSVRVEIEPKSILTAAFVVYTIPVIFFVLGYVVGRVLALLIGRPSVAEPLGVILAFVGFGLSFLVIREVDRRAAPTQRFKPVVREIVR